MPACSPTWPPITSLPSTCRPRKAASMPSAGGGRSSRARRRARALESRRASPAHRGFAERLRAPSGNDEGVAGELSVVLPFELHLPQLSHEMNRFGRRRFDRELRAKVGQVPQLPSPIARVDQLGDTGGTARRFQGFGRPGVDFLGEVVPLRVFGPQERVFVLSRRRLGAFPRKGFHVRTCPATPTYSGMPSRMLNGNVRPSDMPK